MGRELAAAIGRWAALSDHPVQPRLEAVCDPSPEALAWFERIATVRTLTDDRAPAARGPATSTCSTSRSRTTCTRSSTSTRSPPARTSSARSRSGSTSRRRRRIVAALRRADPGVFARCSSEMPYFPGAQLAYEQIRSGALGQMIEARHAFLHSSDLDRGKPINWKRQARYCGEIGVMGDLGMHVVHLPLRLGWRPRSVYAVLQDIVTERPGPDGELVPCDTWDNATLHVDAGGFPLTLETKRIAPGETNTWRLRALGMDGGVDFSTASPKAVHRFARARRPPALGAAGDRQPVGVRDRHRADLRVRLLRRDPADVGRVPGRARGRARRPARLRHAARRRWPSHELWAAAQRSAASGRRAEKSVADAERENELGCWQAATVNEARHHVLDLRVLLDARTSTGPCRSRTRRSRRAASPTRAGCGR